MSYQLIFLCVGCYWVYVVICHLLWPPCIADADIIFLPCDFYLSSSFFFSSPNLSGWRLDVYHTSTHGANLERRSEISRGSLKIHDAKNAKNLPSAHHRTTLSHCIFTTKACIDNPEKNLLNSNISTTWPYSMVNFGPLVAEIVSLVWVTSANFSGFRILATLLCGTLVVGVSQTLQHWTEGATNIRQGSHHVGHWPTF